MEIFNLEKDITLLCVEASSFPDGVLAAHQKLHSMIEQLSERKYYGISNPDISGKIIYKAAVEEMLENEAKNLSLETFALKSGEYISVILKNYMNELSSIGKIFTTLLENPNIDPNGACVEWYFSQNDMRCMVRLKS
jgi:predicted transcriptional regulator YdeE